MNGRMFCEGCKTRMLSGEIDEVAAAEDAGDHGESHVEETSKTAPLTHPKPRRRKKERAAQARGDGVDRERFPVVSYDDIKAGKSLPDGFDGTQKEKYLTEDDFEDLFKMHRKDFEKLKPWKRKELKKGVQLF